MPNPYTLYRQRRKTQPQKLSCTSKRVRIQSGGRRIRIVGNQPIEEATSTGTRYLESDIETAASTEEDQKKQKRKKPEAKKNE
jgi:hypothetical protein